MIWTATNPQCDASVLGSLAPERVLVEYEGPRIFTCRNRDGMLLFVFQCDEDGDLWRYTVVPCSNRRLEQFISGMLTIVQMLAQPWGWVVDIRDGEVVEAAWEIDPITLPGEYRPHQDVRLVPSAEPALSVKLLGSGISQDHVPLSVVKQAAERTMSVVRGLIDYIGTNMPSGLTDKESREYADLPICGVCVLYLGGKFRRGGLS